MSSKVAGGSQEFYNIIVEVVAKVEVLWSTELQWYSKLYLIIMV